MKKLLIIFGMFIAGSPFVSCKKLKDDIKDLQNQANDLQKQNDSLRNSHSALKDQLDGIANAIGSDEPITATTTFEGDDGKSRTVSATYSFKAADYSTQKMVNNGDGTYNVYIERFSDLNWNEGIQGSFNYNPTTKAVKNLWIYHYWSDADTYSDYAYYEGSYTGLTMSVTVDSLNLTTGATSLKFTASATSAYTNSTGWGPNPGKPVSTNFSYVGKLKIFDKD